MAGGFPVRRSASNLLHEENGELYRKYASQQSRAIEIIPWIQRILLCGCAYTGEEGHRIPANRSVFRRLKIQHRKPLESPAVFGLLYSKVALEFHGCKTPTWGIRADGRKHLRAGFADFTAESALFFRFRKKFSQNIKKYCTDFETWCYVLSQHPTPIRNSYIFHCLFWG